MARKVQEIYDKAIHLIDAQNENNGSTVTSDTLEYRVRACELLNTLLNEAYSFSDTYAEKVDEWKAGAEYGQGDKAVYEGGKYLCLVAGTGQTPGTGTDWQLAAKVQKGRRPTLAPVVKLDDMVDMDDYICMSVLPAGLAALFVYDEDQSKYNAFWGDYMNRLIQARATLPILNGFEDIENPYAGIEYGEYGAWPW